MTTAAGKVSNDPCAMLPWLPLTAKMGFPHTKRRMQKPGDKKVERMTKKS